MTDTDYDLIHATLEKSTRDMSLQLFGSADFPPSLIRGEGILICPCQLGVTEVQDSFSKAVAELSRIPDVMGFEYSQTPSDWSFNYGKISPIFSYYSNERVDP